MSEEQKPKKPRSKYQPHSPRSLENLKKNQYKPGQSGNPGGKPPDPITKAIKLLSTQDYIDVINVMVESPMSELKKLIEDPKSSSLKVGLARSILKAIQKGEYNVFEKLTDRLIGPVSTKLQVEAKTESIVTLVDEAKIEAILKKLENDI